MKMVEFPWSRIPVVAALAAMTFVPLAASLHETPDRVTEMCLDTAGKPGYWDCNLGHRVNPSVWNVIGFGLELP